MAGFNYALGVDPTALTRGIMNRLAIEQAQRQAVAEQRTIDRASAFDEAARGVWSNGANPGEISRLITEFPEFAKQLESGYSIMNEAEQREFLRDGSNLFYALEGGNTELAARLMRERVAADREAGREDPFDAQILAMLESGDPEQVNKAKMLAGSALRVAVGPDKWASATQAMTEEGGDFTLSPGSRRYDAMGNIIAEAPFAPRALELGEGETIIEYQPGGGGPASSGSGVQSGAPRGLRNNNPGNLKDGPFAKAQPGYKGADPDGFAIFADSSAGLAAQTKLLQNSYIKRGVDTPSAIVARYAPSSENSPASMQNYAAHIAQRLGIGVNDSIPASQAGALAQAMAEFENGTGGGSRVIARGPEKKPEPVEPSATRVVNGQVFVKVNGQWYRKKS